MKILSFVLVIAFLGNGPFAQAKRKKPAKAYSFIAEAGKASQLECDGEWKIPRKLKHHKDIPKASYMGSELIDSQLPSETNEDMWKHFFRDKSSCNGALAKTPSSRVAAQKEKKSELPEEEATEAEAEEEGDQVNSPDPE